ncbi:MAG: MdtA/MuxA family multidrug efflux RND transporter periplasmic adaptor subunit [Azoarcus sp.]|nr:MdtA/MuxA family multidrug efflux RND transporter periplasmic adaptor subunit [Azoarcus sp.]
MGFDKRFIFRSSTLTLALSLLAGGAASLYFLSPDSTTETPTVSSAEGPPRAGGRQGPGGGQRGPGGAIQPIRATAARAGDLDIVLSALGTATASNTATVKPRVSGQLIDIRFREGQLVKVGDLLAEIDPREYQIQLDQARAQRIKSEAVLGAARVDLERYRALLAQDSIARQQVDTQEALVRQHEGTVEADRAAEANARLQLEFTRVTAPASGRLGLRQVDAGNLVNAQDSAGLVVITQTQPIHAVFSLPADSLAPVLPRLHGKERLGVEAWSRDGRTRLAEGFVLSVDNQIDVSTGSLKLKAEFANQDNSLFPNQFINIRLKADQRNDSILVHTAAIQRNAQGAFVFVIDAEQRVQARQIRLGPAQGELVVVEDGLAAGERLVLDGADRLREGSRVDVLSVDGVALARGTAGEQPAAPDGNGARTTQIPQAGLRPTAARPAR